MGKDRCITSCTLEVFPLTVRPTQLPHPYPSQVLGIDYMFYLGWGISCKLFWFGSYVVSGREGKPPYKLQTFVRNLMFVEEMWLNLLKI